MPFLFFFKNSKKKPAPAFLQHVIGAGISELLYVIWRSWSNTPRFLIRGW